MRKAGKLFFLNGYPELFLGFAENYIVSVIRLTRDAVAVAIHMFAISRLSDEQRRLAHRADLVAAFIIDRRFGGLDCGSLGGLDFDRFVVGLDRKIIHGEKGQPCQGGNAFQERVAGHIATIADRG